MKMILKKILYQIKINVIVLKLLINKIQLKMMYFVLNVNAIDIQSIIYFNFKFLL